MSAVIIMLHMYAAYNCIYAFSNYYLFNNVFNYKMKTALFAEFV